tara:strand:+ start:395 stop:625 length:231 start_codon:yes stop_codon:yes gene_type:complete
MKLFNAITATAVVIGTSFIAANPAKAGGCYPALASTIIEQVINGGGSAQQGWEAARQEGNWDGSEVCTYRVRSYLR